MEQRNEIRSPVKAIRAFCLGCVGNSPTEVRLCVSTKCPLYPFRFGKNPYRTSRTISPEQREAAAKRLAEWREKSERVASDES